MAKSRFFVAFSLVTAASIAVSSVASARYLAPVAPSNSGNNPVIWKIDKRDKRERWREKRERKRVKWERSYRDHDRGKRYKRDRGRDWRGPRRASPPRDRAYGNKHRYRLPPGRSVIVRRAPPGPRIVPPPHRRHRYRHVWVHRPHGHWYSGYGHHYHDHDAYHFLAFTAISLGLLSLLTVSQQRAQEQAQIEATTAPVGSTVRWDDANRSGSVSVLRDGRSSDGQYCREFQQTVTVGGRSEQAYGVACRQPDGAWRIVETR